MFPIASLLSTLLLIVCLAGPSLPQPVSRHRHPLGNLTKRAVPYRPFSGPAHNFPGVDTFTPYNKMWKLNLPTLLASGGNTATDVQHIESAINDCAAQHGVDRRVLLGILMQESRGDVGVITTYSGGLPTAGLMQCSGCAGFPGQHGLSRDNIKAMVCGGAQHFRGNMDHWGNKWSRMSVFPALREYNSGNVNAADLGDGRGATASYVADVANRVTGWVN